MRQFLTILLFAALSTALPAQTQQAQPKPHTCTYYGQDMKYCGAKSWESANRCKKHAIEAAKKSVANYFRWKYKGKVIIPNF